MNQVYRATIATIASAVLSTFPSTVLAQSEIQLGQRVRYIGPFTNTTYNLSGNVVIEVVFESNNRISGYINFTNYPGVRTLCGAGNFTGTRQGRTLQFNFVSNDPEPDCGFDRGWNFTVSATLSQDNSVLQNGRYQVGGGGAGVFTANSPISRTQTTSPTRPVDSEGRRLHSAGTWLEQRERLTVQAGQGIHLVLRNGNVLPVDVDVRDTSFTAGNLQRTVVLPPSGEAHIVLSKFGAEPMTWDLLISSAEGRERGVFVVNWQLYSTWVPGDPPNR